MVQSPRRSDSDEFVENFRWENKHRCLADLEKDSEGRWRYSIYEVPAKRDSLNFDIFWLKDRSLELVLTRLRKGEPAFLTAVQLVLDAPVPYAMLLHGQDHLLVHLRRPMGILPGDGSRPAQSLLGDAMRQVFAVELSHLCCWRPANRATRAGPEQSGY